MKQELRKTRTTIKQILYKNLEVHIKKPIRHECIAIILLNILEGLSEREFKR